MARRARLVLVVVIAALVLAGVGALIVATRTDHVPAAAPPPPSSAPPVSPTTPPPAPPAPCVVAVGARQQDVDTDDRPDAPWPRPAGREVVVHVETVGLPRRYANAVRIAAALWSRAPCVEVIVVDRCPPRSNCTTVSVTRRSEEGEDVDGSSEGTERRGVKTGNAITLFTAPLSTSSDRAALGTVVHEMGHALGLDHRGNPNSIMAASTGERTDPRPDPVDYANLAAIYGDRAP